MSDGRPPPRRSNCNARAPPTSAAKRSPNAKHGPRESSRHRTDVVDFEASSGKHADDDATSERGDPTADSSLSCSNGSVDPVERAAPLAQPATPRPRSNGRIRYHPGGSQGA